MLNDTTCGPRPTHTLNLFDTRSGTRYDIADRAMLRFDNAALRRDLHPRWDRTGTKVCVDAAHSGLRQMYVLDVSEIVAL